MYVVCSRRPLRPSGSDPRALRLGAGGAGLDPQILAMCWFIYIYIYIYTHIQLHIYTYLYKRTRRVPDWMRSGLAVSS